MLFMDPMWVNLSLFISWIKYWLTKHNHEYLCYIAHYFSSLRASVVFKFLMHKFKWLNGKGMISTYLCIYLWASRPYLHASVCIWVHQAQETLPPRCLAKTFKIVTKCHPCANCLRLVLKCLVLVAWLVACYECCRIDVLKNSTSMVGCVSKLKTFGS